MPDEHRRIGIPQMVLPREQRESGTARYSPPPLRERLLDLLIGLVLTKRVHCPDRCRNPANQRDLENEADDAGNRLADGKKGLPGKKKGNQ